MLTLADSLNTLIGTMLRMSDEYREVVVPEFTNGVVAQPNSLGHVILARVIEGGPQASEMQRMLSETAARHKGYLDWTKSSHEYLDAAEERLERDFHELISRLPVSEAESDRSDTTDQCPDILYLRSEI